LGSPRVELSRSGGMVASGAVDGLGAGDRSGALG
jgi:hypothetical protein